MNNKSLPLVIVAVLLLAGLLFLGLRSQKVLHDGLPPKEELENKSEAYLAAINEAESDLSRIGAVLGTGSMQPYIRASAEGLDPYKTVVAFTVRVKDATFDDIKPGDLCTYEPESHPGQLWLHQAASKDSGGWIMTGLHNKHYENWMRVTPRNFRGIVQKTFTWKP